MTFKLEPYQLKIKYDSNIEFNKGNKHVFVQAPTRCGKTVIFSDIVNDFINDQFPSGIELSGKGDTLILVHDKKIMRQIKKTLYQWHNIQTEEITSKTRTISRSLFSPKKRVFIAMVETINNRLKLPSFLAEMQNIGLIIADEAHLSNFKKIYKHPLLEETLRLGFSATPISADKKDHLYPTYFTSIVIGPSVKDLIEVNRLNPTRGVVKDITRVLDQLPDKEKFSTQIDGDVNQAEVGEELSGTRQIRNTVNAYITYTFGKKMLCFCASKSHSRDVCAAFIGAGVNARHIDSDLPEEQIDATMAWFSRTPGAVLCNVGMTVMGYDEPTCEGVIMNTLTRSISKCKQAEARGGTPCTFPDGSTKLYHYILDMCNNTSLHGEWSDDVDWREIFMNPKYSTPGVAPKKECKICRAINAASARECCLCGEPFDFAAPVEDTEEKGMVLISKDIDVKHTVEIFSSRNEYAAMFDILRQVAFLARKKLNVENYKDFEYLLEQSEFDEFWKEAQDKIKEWRVLIGKASIEIRYESIRSAFEEKLRSYGFLLNIEDIGSSIMVGKKTKI